MTRNLIISIPLDEASGFVHKPYKKDVSSQLF
jgi:hypothetical protein